MSNVLVLCYSAYDHIELMAQAFAEWAVLRTQGDTAPSRATTAVRVRVSLWRRLRTMQRRAWSGATECQSETMALDLETLNQARPRGQHAMPVLDQAGWHSTPKLPRLANLSLLPLQAGSPKLNPVEQAWQQLRDRSLANRCYDNDEQIVEACRAPWNKFTQSFGTIRSLCMHSWTHLITSSIVVQIV
jgi:transposase